MLARCTRCSQTFQTDRYGDQFCTYCGAPVRIDAPSGPAGASAPEGGAPPPDGSPSTGAPPPSTPRPIPADLPGASPQDESAPLDQPDAHGGFFPAFVATWKRSVLEPGAFYERLRVGSDFGGALSYAAICVLVGGLFVGLYQGGLFAVQASLLPQQAPFARLLSKLPAAGLVFGSAVGIPVMAFVGLFINAALMHLALKIVGGARGGFNATFRALGYATGPYLFGLVPLCGGTISGIWILIVSVIGLSKMHRITVGRTLAAYGLLLFVSCCCCGVPAAIGGGMAASSLVEHSGGLDLSQFQQDD